MCSFFVFVFPLFMAPKGDDMAAGRPSNWEDARRTSYAGKFYLYV